ncbi:MAG: BlaI/MecI/CopY family transcriptional regulator [Fimbriimonadaceae bacterium]|nr:MAG: BlaI/MecI/CopY family transcriptional regulator [Fimbriimonadaceae bacterium]
MTPLSKRETQIMEAIYSLGRGSVADVIDAMSNPAGYSAVRAQLRILEEKGHLQHEEKDGKYVYSPVQPKQEAARGMMRRVVDSFFGGSRSAAVLSLLGDDRTKLSEAEIYELEELIRKAKEEQE